MCECVCRGLPVGMCMCECACVLCVCVLFNHTIQAMLYLLLVYTSVDCLCMHTYIFIIPLCGVCSLGPDVRWTLTGQSLTSPCHLRMNSTK